MTTVKPRRVDFLNEKTDLQCAVLASLGFATAYICERTGLSPCQVMYRLRKVSIKRADYRNGESALAQTVVMGGAYTKSAQAIRDWASRNGQARKS